MKLSTKLVGAVAIAGIIGLGGTAFTGAGLKTTNTAASAQFLGGTVNQTVYGASVDSVAYTTNPGTQEVTAITVTFKGTAAEMTTLAALDASKVTVAATGGAPVGLFTGFAGVAGVVGGSGNNSTDVWTFTADAGSYDGIRNLSIAVDGTP